MFSGPDTDGDSLKVTTDTFTLTPIQNEAGNITYSISKDNPEDGTDIVPEYIVIGEAPEATREIAVPTSSEDTIMAVTHEKDLVKQNRLPSKIVKNLQPQKRKNIDEYKLNPDNILSRRTNFSEKLTNLKNFQLDANSFAPDYVNGSLIVAERPSDSGFSNSFVAQKCGEFPSNIFVLPPSTKRENVKQIKVEEETRTKRKVAKAKQGIPAQKAKLNERLLSVYQRLSKTAVSAGIGLVFAISVNEKGGQTVRYIEFGGSFENGRISLSSENGNISIQPILLPKILKAQAEQNAFLKSPKTANKNKPRAKKERQQAELFVTISPNQQAVEGAEIPEYRVAAQTPVPDRMIEAAKTINQENPSFLNSLTKLASLSGCNNEQVGGIQNTVAENVLAQLVKAAHSEGFASSDVCPLITDPVPVMSGLNTRLASKQHSTEQDSLSDFQLSDYVPETPDKRRLEISFNDQFINFTNRKQHIDNASLRNSPAVTVNTSVESKNNSPVLSHINIVDHMTPAMSLSLGSLHSPTVLLDQVTPAQTSNQSRTPGPDKIELYAKKVLVSDHSESEEDLTTPVKKVVNVAGQQVAKKLFQSGGKQVRGGLKIKPKKSQVVKKQNLFGAVTHAIKRPSMAVNKTGGGGNQLIDDDSDDNEEEAVVDPKYEKAHKIMKLKHNFLCNDEISDLF